MKVYSLSGPSGTGKSTSALSLAHTNQIQAIIDDGLLIVNGLKVAGTSAKFEKNSLTAVKRAIFNDDEHCHEVKVAIDTYKVDSILIIGTSVKMTKHIATRLELGEINHYIQVENIRSDAEIKMAKFIRTTQGKHVMPIPYKQVEQNFFKRLIHKGKDIFSNKKEKIGETTIVHPDFHQETIQINRAVYISLVSHILANEKYITKFEHGQFTMDSHLPFMEVDIWLFAPVHYNVIEKMTMLQRKLNEAFLNHFEIPLGEIILHIRGIESGREV